MENLSTGEKKKLFSMFSNMESTQPYTKTLNSDVLLVDGLNNYFRAFMSNPSLNDNGLHVGGISGFLKTIGYAINILNPSRVIVIFDGKGGSLKRKKIYPEYKDHRNPTLRFNRAYEDLCNSEQEDNNRINQLLRIVSYLDNLPVTTMAIDYIEADDTIAYCANNYFKDSEKVYIMSTDKDYLQLLNNRINVWSPTKKKLYGCAELLLEYGISCQNFLLYRCLTGDESDNIDGVTGAGLKTIKKCFPFLSDSKEYSLEDIYSHCELNKSNYKLYSSILKSKDLLYRNYQLMQLKNSDIQPTTQLRIKSMLDTSRQKLDRIKFATLLTEDNMHSNLENHQVWLTEIWTKLNTFVTEQIKLETPN